MWQKIALSLPFGDDGSWSGKVTIGMGVVAFTSATPSGLTAAAYYAVYENLVCVNDTLTTFRYKYVL